VNRSVHRQLSGEEFDRLFEQPMTNETGTADAVVDIWPYVDSVDPRELGDITLHDVAYVYRHPNGRWEHVVVATCAEDVHLVIVIDRHERAILGHHLLNLRRKYGLTEH
jgi:hypothetical protein